MYTLLVNCDISICHWMYTFLLNKRKICLMYIYALHDCIGIQLLILCVTLKFIIYASYMYIVYGFFSVIVIPFYVLYASSKSFVQMYMYPLFEKSIFCI